MSGCGRLPACSRIRVLVPFCLPTRFPACTHACLVVLSSFLSRMHPHIHACLLEPIRMHPCSSGSHAQEQCAQLVSLWQATSASTPCATCTHARMGAHACACKPQLLDLPKQRCCPHTCFVHAGRACMAVPCFGEIADHCCAARMQGCAVLQRDADHCRAAHRGPPWAVGRAARRA